MTNILLIIAIGLLTTLIILAIVGLSRLSNLKELCERVHDKLSCINSGIDKLGTAVDWWLGREGFKLEYAHINWRWFVTRTDDKSSIYRTVAEMDRDKREALARALYEANLQAMRDFNKEQEKKNQRGKK